MSRKKAPARKRTGAFRVKSPGRLHECPSVPAGSKACMPEKETPPRMPLSGKKATYESPGLSRAERTRRNPCGNGACAGKNTTKRTPGKSRSVPGQREGAPDRPHGQQRNTVPRRKNLRPAPTARPADGPLAALPIRYVLRGARKGGPRLHAVGRSLRPSGRQGGAERPSGGRHSPAAFIRKTRSPGRVRFFWKNKEPCPPAPSAHPASSFPPGSGRPRPR